MDQPGLFELDGDRPPRGVAGLPAEVWRTLVDHAATRERYAARVYRRGPQECWYWLGTISSTGHGKLRAGSRSESTSRIVTAHVYGYQLRYGVLAPRPGEDLVISHACDEYSCQNPAHWHAEPRAENNREREARRWRAAGALADARGAQGRAVAVRDAIRAARDAGEDVEVAIAAATAAGMVEAERLL